LDRATVTDGRMADPDRVDEAVMTASAARMSRLHVGQVVAMGYLSSFPSRFLFFPRD